MDNSVRRERKARSSNEILEIAACVATFATVLVVGIIAACLVQWALSANFTVALPTFAAMNPGG